MSVYVDMLDAADAAHVAVEEQEVGVFRLYRAEQTAPVGLVVLRDGRIRYAEAGGHVFPFHRLSDHRRETADVIASIRELRP